MDTLREETHTLPQSTESAVTPSSAPVEGTSVPVLETTHTEVATVPFYKSKPIIVSLIVAIVLLGGAVFHSYATTLPNGAVAMLCLKENTLLGVCYKGKKMVTTAQLDENIALITNVAEQQGADINQPSIQAEIRTQALNILIDNALILGAAEQAGHTATDEEVQAKYDELVATVGGAETFAEELSKSGVSEEKLRSNIRERILADKLIESNTDIESLAVSEEELAETYKTLVEANPDMPALEDIKPMIEAQLLGEKQQQLMEAFLASVRDATNIVVAE